jgi:hypothetical protein
MAHLHINDLRLSVPMADAALRFMIHGSLVQSRLGSHLLRRKETTSTQISTSKGSTRSVCTQFYTGTLSENTFPSHSIVGMICTSLLQTPHRETSAAGILFQKFRSFQLQFKCVVDISGCTSTDLSMSSFRICV